MLKENQESKYIFQKLQTAARESQRREIEILAEESALEPHVFSDSFNLKMAKLMRFSHKPYFSLANTAKKRIAVLIATILISITVTTFSVDAIRIPFVNFVVSVYEKFSSVVFREKEENGYKKDLPTTIEEIYLPEQLPAGYALIESNDYGVLIETIYSNGSEDFVFEQYIIPSTQINIDTEGVETEKIDVRGIEVLFYRNKDFNNILWTDGSYGYKITGTINKEDMIKLVKLTKK